MKLKTGLAAFHPSWTNGMKCPCNHLLHYYMLPQWSHRRPMIKKLEALGPLKVQKRKFFHTPPSKSPCQISHFSAGLNDRCPLETPHNIAKIVRRDFKTFRRVYIIPMECIRQYIQTWLRDPFMLSGQMHHVRLL